jgi:hypothetical protein
MRIKIEIIFLLKSEIEKKNQYRKKRINFFQKNEDQNWHKNLKQCFDWMVKLKRIITFTKGPRKKLKIKTIRTELKNIIPSIWIEGWNWKLIKLIQKK